MGSRVDFGIRDLDDKYAGQTWTCRSPVAGAAAKGQQVGTRYDWPRLYRVNSMHVPYNSRVFKEDSQSMVTVESQTDASLYRINKTEKSVSCG